MKYLLLITTLLSLTSCFKTDTDGNVFFFENGNSAQLQFNFSNLNPNIYYFGTNNEVSVSTNTVTAFTTNRGWCLERINYQIDSGTFSPSGAWEVYINGNNDAMTYGPGESIGRSIYPGDNLVISMNCAGCTSTKGKFWLEMSDCNN